MAVAAVEQRAPVRTAPVLFAIAILVSAALVFVVEPMIAKMILPQLGGSPTVWNTAMAFFQAALLAGYGYAHLLQRLAPPRVQALIHLLVLAIAALFLPVHVTGVLGPPSVDAPTLWLLGVLVASVGVFFVVLCATAPLLQAWFARSDAQKGPSAYVLYAASNLGSMLALLAYPVIVEPLAALPEQATVWAYVYAGFCLMVAGIGLFMRRDAALADSTHAAPPSTAAWRERATWIALAAGPAGRGRGAAAGGAGDGAAGPRRG